MNRAAILVLLILAMGFGTSYGQQPQSGSDATIFPKLFDKPPKLGAPDFVARTFASESTEAALSVFNQTLWEDLEFSAVPELLPKSFYPLRPLRLPRDVDFDNWRIPSLDADFLVFGNLQADGGTVVIEAYLFDVPGAGQVFAKRYRVPEERLVRGAAHQFSDEVINWLTAQQSTGVAQSKIAYTSLKGDSKEVIVSDYDGMNPRTITANGGLNKFPAFSPDNQKLAFVTKLPNASSWELWIQDLTGGRQVIETPSSYVSSPAFSPDGTRLAFAARPRSATSAEVLSSRLDGSGMRNLTNHPSIDTSPAWSPTGQQLAFISDRSGTPQLWVMDSDGSNVRRLVNEGGHCDSPDWSPDGRFVAYSWQAPKQWTHDIYIVEVATGKIMQLTSGVASNENPHFSADGRHVTFQSDRTGNKQVFIMNVSGNNLKQVTAYGINDSPAWSGYPLKSER